MSDLLLELGRLPQARSAVQALGLPLSLPQPLQRTSAPWAELELRDRAVAALAHDPASPVVPHLAAALTRAGANPILLDPALSTTFEGPGEAWARPARLTSAEDAPRLDAIVLDLTTATSVDDLRLVYDSLRPLLPALSRCGRVLLLGSPVNSEQNISISATMAALEGFTRSLAKEIGRDGATANLLRVAPDALDRLGMALRFLLSPRAAFIDGQPLHLDALAAAPPATPLTRPLAGRTALVTGAARGIGRATATALAREGAHVLVLDRPEDDGPTSQLARELRGTPLLVNLADPDAAETVAEAVRAAGGVDVIVHNAGIIRDRTFARMKPQHWDDVLQINLRAVLALHEALEPLLRDQGRIVALSSIAGMAGNMGQTAYAASKAGVMGFVQAAAPRLAHRGVTVNAIAPGFIETQMTASIPSAIREVARRLAALSQGGLPEDIAEVVTFLASPGAVGFTGRTLRVCGGAFVGA